MKNFIIIDGNALVHRAFHALPPLKTKDGQPVNAVYGFVSILFRVIKELKPSYLAATFDLAGPTFRDLEYREYKAKRVKADQSLYDQIPLVKKMVQAMGVPIYEKAGFEADDVIGTIACLVRKEKPLAEIIIVTGDLDALQLVDEKTKVYTMKKGIKDTIIYDQAEIDRKYGLKPSQIVDFKGLKGDSSDNIPGAPGIGEKTALELIKKFGNLDNLYAGLERSDVSQKLQARLLEHKEQVLFSRRLATIRRDVPLNFKINDCRWPGPKQNLAGLKMKITRALAEFNFNSLIKRLDEII